MPFIPLGVVDVLKKFEIAIFWKKYYNIKNFQDEDHCIKMLTINGGISEMKKKEITSLFKIRH